MTSTNETETKLSAVEEENENVDIVSAAPVSKVTLQDWVGIFEIMTAEQAKLLAAMTQFQNTPTPDGYEVATDILDDFDSAVCFLRNTVEAILIGSQDSPAFKDVAMGASAKPARKSKSKSPSSSSDIGSIKKRVSAEEKESKAKERAEAKEAKAKERAAAKEAKAAAKAKAKSEKATASSSSSGSGDSSSSDSNQKKRKRSAKKDVPTSYEVKMGC